MCAREYVLFIFDSVCTYVCMCIYELLACIHPCIYVHVYICTVRISYACLHAFFEVCFSVSSVCLHECCLRFRACFHVCDGASASRKAAALPAPRVSAYFRTCETHVLKEPVGEQHECLDSVVSALVVLLGGKRKEICFATYARKCRSTTRNQR
jgi:hypothetical protein